jgi:hypothetical protein
LIFFDSDPDPLKKITLKRVSELFRGPPYTNQDPTLPRILEALPQFTTLSTSNDYEKDKCKT